MSEENRPSAEAENLLSTDDHASDDAETSADLEESEFDLEQQLVIAREQAAEYLDGWQRARAEFANARKRLEQGRSEAYRNATVDFTRKLLPALDDFERASDNVPEDMAANSWYDGLLLIKRKLETVLEDLHVERIEAVGEEFDPNFHEALMLKEQDDVESGLVIEELQVGYRIGDQVIRPSLVNVAA